MPSQLVPGIRILKNISAKDHTDEKSEEHGTFVMKTKAVNIFKVFRELNLLGIIAVMHDVN